MAYRKRKQTVKRDGTDRQRDGGGEMKRERKRKRKRDQERERKMERGRERETEKERDREMRREMERGRGRERRGGEIGDQVTEEAETEMCHLKAKKRQLVTTRRKNLFLETLEITIVLPTSQFQNSSLQNLRE